MLSGPGGFSGEAELPRRELVGCPDGSGVSSFAVFFCGMLQRGGREQQGDLTGDVFDTWWEMPSFLATALIHSDKVTSRDSQVHMLPGSIAVLGGGLTGLSAAFHLSRRFPTTRIVLINRDTRFGGWVRSEKVRLTLGSREAEVLLEAGPRTLRPNAPSVLELVCGPMSHSAVLLTAAAKTRFTS